MKLISLYVTDALSFALRYRTTMDIGIQLFECTEDIFEGQGYFTRDQAQYLPRGRADARVSAIARKYVFRPGFINPRQKTATSRIPAWMVRPFYRPIPIIGIDASALAGIMVDVGPNGNEQAILENRDIRGRARMMSKHKCGL